MKRRPDSESSETVKKSSEKMTERQRKFFKMCYIEEIRKKYFGQTIFGEEYLSDQSDRPTNHKSTN